MSLNSLRHPEGRQLYQQFLDRISFKPWMSYTNATFSILLSLTVVYLGKLYISSRNDKNAEEADPDHDHSVLKNHSTIKSYTTDAATYTAIRTFYHPHKHAEKLQAISDLPLIVFIHGLGGSLPQFAPLLGSFINIAPCFGLDLPGHGKSSFVPKAHNAYTFEAFCKLWHTAIEATCREYGHKKVFFIAHSMGCSIAAKLATDSARPFEVVGLVAICPKATPPSAAEVKQARRFLSLPDTMLNLLRALDRRGGVNSKSVERMAGKAAGVDLRRQQLAFNQRFRTAVWKRSALGLLPDYDKTGLPTNGLPGKTLWSKIEVPIFLIAGEADTVTKPGEVAEIVSFMKRLADSSSAPDTEGETIPTADPDSFRKTTSPTANDAAYGTLPTTHQTCSHTSTIIKTAILPTPAAHALMYDHSTYRTVAGLIEDFLTRHISQQLSLGWQLQQLTTTGKWEVKNLEKWKKVLPVSGPIGHPPTTGIFRALKTLREQDEVHTPAVFLKTWREHIFAVVDISHDSPIYSPGTLERGGIQYHKFPTVSKVPPTTVEVADFIALIDRLRSEAPHTEQGKQIGVHCHYGYNRTGFFICAYLIEKCGYGAQDAVEEFKRMKEPGIRHEHFIDTLFMRYHVGLRRAGTGNVDARGESQEERRESMGSVGSVNP